MVWLWRWRTGENYSIIPSIVPPMCEENAHTHTHHSTSSMIYIRFCRPLRCPRNEEERYRKIPDACEDRFIEFILCFNDAFTGTTMSIEEKYLLCFQALRFGGPEEYVRSLPANNEPNSPFALRKSFVHEVKTQQSSCGDILWVTTSISFSDCLLFSERGVRWERETR